MKLLFSIVVFGAIVYGQNQPVKVEQKQISIVENKGSSALKDGLYAKLEDLVAGRPQTGSYKLEQRNGSNQSYYFLKDTDGKKVKSNFAYVEDGILYVRASDTKHYLTEKKSQRFGNTKIFVKMEEKDAQYSADIPFTNNTVSWIGIAVSGVTAGILAPGIGSAAVFGGAGAGLFALAATSKKELVVDLKNQTVALE